jgi:hypothetical protein
MKRHLAFWSALWLMAPVAWAEVLEHTVRFDGLSPVIQRAGEYQVLSAPGLTNLARPGLPWLPVSAVTLLLPPGASIQAVSGRPAFRTLDGRFNLYPAQQCLPISGNFTPDFVKDQDRYSSDQPFPPDPVISWSQGNAGGYRLASLVLCPFRYQPLSGTLQVLERLDISVRYQAGSAKTWAAGNSGGWAVREAANYPAANAWYPAPPKNGGYDLLIVTPPEYDTVYQRLAEWKRQRGLSVKIAALDSVYAIYPGRDPAERLRNFVAQQHLASGISHLLLGGDYGPVPGRTAFALHSGYEEFTGKPGLDSLICDLYYGDLDGSWDLNGNGVFGEPADSVDMYPELWVGRAPVSSLEQAQTFVGKVLEYEKTPPREYLPRASFWASWLDPSTDGALAKEIVFRDFLSGYFSPPEKLYQSLGNHDPASVVSALEQGRHLINHNAHSGFFKMQGGNGWLDTTLMDTLENSGKWGILYSVGCQAAGFDSSCIAEHFVNNPSGGGLAFIGNSRYGWYFPGFPGYSPSYLYDNAFFDRLLVRPAPDLGQAVGLSKAGMVPLSQADGYFRWVNYNLNLLGDPTLAVWRSGPDSLRVACPDSFNSGPFSVMIQAADSKGPAAGALVTLRTDSAYFRSVADEAGTAVLSGFVSGPQQALLTVWAPDCIPHQQDLSIVDPGPCLSPAGQRWVELPGDGLASPGEAGAWELLVKNTGTLPSGSGARAVLRARDSLSAVLDSVADISGLMPGDSLWTAGITITIDPACRDGAATNYELSLADSAGNVWNYRMALAISAPSAVMQNYLASDSAGGNGNAVPEPGETITLQVVMGNQGGAALENGFFSLESGDSLVSITRSADSLSLPAGSSAGLAFSFIIDAAAPDSGRLLQFLIRGEYPGGPSLDTLVLAVGPAGMADQMEGGSANWTVSDSGWWHQSSLNFHSPGQSWYFGTESGGWAPYTARDTLESRPFLIGQNYQLSFWQWYEFIPEWSYGFIELSGSFGSRLLDLLAGSSSGWERRSYDLSGYQPGEALRLRFIALTDSAGPEVRSRGWFIDDVAVEQAPSGAGNHRQLPGPVDQLLPGYPNPFSSGIRIPFSLSRSSRVEMAAYNVLGQRIATLVSGVYPAGRHIVTWDGSSQDGSRLAAGVYLLRLTLPGRSLIRKITKLK